MTNDEAPTISATDTCPVCNGQIHVYKTVPRGKCTSCGIKVNIKETTMTNTKEQDILSIAKGRLATQLRGLVDLWPTDPRVQAMVSRYTIWYNTEPPIPTEAPGTPGHAKWVAGLTMIKDAEALRDSLRANDDDPREGESTPPESDNPSGESTNQGDTPNPMTMPAEGTLGPATPPRGKSALQSEDPSATVKGITGHPAGHQSIVDTDDQRDNGVYTPDKGEMMSQTPTYTMQKDIPTPDHARIIAKAAVATYHTRARFPDQLVLVEAILPKARKADVADALIRWANAWQAPRNGKGIDPDTGRIVGKTTLYREALPYLQVAASQYGTTLATRFLQGVDHAMEVGSKAVAIVANGVGSMGGTLAAAGINAAITTVTTTMGEVTAAHRDRVVQRATHPNPNVAAYRAAREQLHIDRAVQRAIRVARGAEVDSVVAAAVSKAMGQSMAESMADDMVS